MIRWLINALDRLFFGGWHEIERDLQRYQKIAQRMEKYDND